MNESKQVQVEQFFKDAFAIDGEAKVLPARETRQLIMQYYKTMEVVQLTDSKRGTFYVATFKTQ